MNFFSFFLLSVFCLIFSPFVWIFAIYKLRTYNLPWMILSGVLMAFGYPVWLTNASVAAGILMIFASNIIMFVVFTTIKPKQNTIVKNKTWNNAPAHDPKAFEAQIGDMFRTHGYRVMETPYQGDHGIDLKIYRHDEFAIVQCKRYSSSVGEPVVRDFFGCMQHEGADFGYIVTTSSFTKQAIEWSKGKKIMLIDGNTLQALLDEVTEIKNKSLG